LYLSDKILFKYNFSSSLLLECGRLANLIDQYFIYDQNLATILSAM